MWKDDADRTIESAISSGLNGHLVTSWIVIAETIGNDGDRRIAVNAAPDQRTTTTLGLLRYATVVEEHATVRSWDRDD